MPRGVALVLPAKFGVWQHVRISKENMKFAKSSKHNVSTEIFRIVNVINGRPRSVHELGDLKVTRIDGQFYQEEMAPYGSPPGRLIR